ncbi:MAG: ATP-dependent Clp protease ATP-binding subunit [Ruminococcaceae bacterium]|nr:ATP-dependent Clp protease ATP-binding subunit [Oscillospiraceae bacterium]
MNIGFTKKAQNALNSALTFASEMGHTFVGSEHLLLGLLAEKDGIASRVLDERGVTFDKTKQLIGTDVGFGKPTSLTAADITPRTKRIIESSATIAVGMGHGYIGTEHLLLAVCDENECFAIKLISEQGAAPADIKQDIMSYFGTSAEKKGGRVLQVKPDEGLNSCPTLTQYGRNLCKMAKEGKIDPIIGRERETARVVQILSRRTKNNPCLIGEPGVGKTAVVEGLAQLIVQGRVPDTLREKVIVTLDISSMIAGAKYRGEFEERMKNVMQEVLRNRQVILFIDEIHTIIGAGGAEGAVDAANIIKPALARGEMQVIGATTIDEYRRHIEKDAALERRFQSVSVGEPTREEAEQILFGLRDKYEAHHKLKICDGAIKAAVELSVRYISDRYLPDKAIDLIDEAASKKRISANTPGDEERDLEGRLKSVTAEKEEAILGEDYETAARLRDEEKRLAEELMKKKSDIKNDDGQLVVTEEDIAEIVTGWTGIPVQKLAEQEGERLINLDKILKERIIGQGEAVESVARAIRRGRMGLKDPGRPIGSFIFLGPTGVGKTELSRALADFLFGDPSSLIRVDMSEYMEKHSVSKIIGSPPGYIGFDEGGQLAEKVRRRPYSVVLFDEIEKAHPDVFNILLQILEDGILTDSQGRRVDFKNTVIIMTSNAGAAGMTETKRLGFADHIDRGEEEARIRASVMDTLKRTFKPEFINRVDEIIIFNKLTDEDIQKIARIMLGEVEKRIADVGVGISFSDEVVASLAKEGFDTVYGARPLRRAIVRRVEDSFSEAMLRGEINPGDEVDAVLEDGEIQYKVKLKTE